MFDLYIRKMDLVGLKDYELPVKLVLSMFPRYKDNTAYVTVDELCHRIYGKYLDRTNDKRTIALVRKGLTSLIEKGKVKCVESYKDNYILDYDTCYCNTDGNFIVIHLDELQLIMSETNNCDVLLYFVNLIGTVNGNTKSWHMSQEDMCECWCMNFMTIDKYNKILEDLKLIYVHRPNARKKDGTFHKVNNSYGRYIDRENIIADAGVYFANTDEEYYKAKDKIDGDTRTSIKMRYNGFVKGAKKYDGKPKLIEELYADCVKYNNSIDDQNEANGVTLLDLSVFTCIDTESGKYVVDGDYKSATPLLESNTFTPNGEEPFTPNGVFGKSERNNFALNPFERVVSSICDGKSEPHNEIDIDKLIIDDDEEWIWDMY